YSAGAKKSDPFEGTWGSAGGSNVFQVSASTLKRLAIPLLFTAACSSSEAGRPVSSSQPSQAGSGPTGPNTGPVEQASCPSQPVPLTPLRRLTRFEYQNAVRDLLQVDTSAASELPA